MTTYLVGYRIRLYAGRSVDPTETTVLTPAGSAHSDPFQLSTLAGIPGYQPYLQMPEGRSSRIDLMSRRLDTGQRTFELIDKSVDGTNIRRWLTNFAGDSLGRPRLGGLRFEADETLDGGLTWNRWSTGRTQRVRVGQSRAWLTVYDGSDDMKMRIFTNPPSSTVNYVARQALLPVGGIFGSPYGTKPVCVPLTGQIQNAQIAGGNLLPGIVMTVWLNTASRSRKDNFVTEQQVRAMAPGQVTQEGFDQITPFFGYAPDFSGTMRCRLKRLDTLAEGDFQAACIIVSPFSQTVNIIFGFMITPLGNTADAGYMAMPPATTNVEVTLWNDGPISEDNPLLINDVHWAQLGTDLAAGKFGYLYRPPETLPPTKNYGDPKRSVAQSNFAAFLADTTYAPMRFIIKKPEEFISWIEKRLLKVNNIALYIDEQGRLTAVDLRPPTSVVGLPTITDADLVTRSPREWEQDRSKIITRVDFKRYSDSLWTNDSIQDIYETASAETFPSVKTPVQSVDHPLIILDVGAGDVGDEPEEVDAEGFRSMSGETYQGQPREKWLEGKLRELAHDWRRPFGWGLVTIPLEVRRSVALLPGGLALMTVSHVVDPTTNQRGTTRLVRALEVTKQGGSQFLQVLDMGVNSIAGVPTLGAPALEAGNNYTGVTVLFTLNGAGNPGELRYAVTSTAVGVAPADNSPLWTIFGEVIKATGTVIMRNLPPGFRIWVQGRTLADFRTSLQPSAWVLAGSVDTTALPSITGLTSSLITAKSFRVSWTNGAADLSIEILLATPTGDPRQRIAILQRGSDRFDFLTLVASTQYRTGFRYSLGPFVGPEATLDVTTNSTATVAPDMVGGGIVRR